MVSKRRASSAATAKKAAASAGKADSSPRASVSRSPSHDNRSYSCCDLWPAMDTALSQAVAPRDVEPTTWRYFLIWTALLWSSVPVCYGLFASGKIDFATSAKISLYLICLWLNAPLIACLRGYGSKLNGQLQRLHDFIALWSVSYLTTNCAWELPFVLFAPSIFPGRAGDIYYNSGQNNHTVIKTVQHLASQPLLADVSKQPIHSFFFWIVSSFGSVDLRTVNHAGSFRSVELLCFLNIAMVVLFFVLNRRGSALRYLVPLAGGGAPFAATFIFTFSEIADNYANMPGGNLFWSADTWLSLVWTQYQYCVYPVVCSLLAVPLLYQDWKRKK